MSQVGQPTPNVIPSRKCWNNYKDNYTFSNIPTCTNCGYTHTHTNSGKQTINQNERDGKSGCRWGGKKKSGEQLIKWKKRKNVRVKKNLLISVFFLKYWWCPRWLAAIPHGWSAPDAFWSGNDIQGTCKSVFGKYSNIPENLLATLPHRIQQPLQRSTPFLLNWHTRPAAGEFGNWSIMMVSSSWTLKITGPRHPSPLYRVCTEHHCRRKYLKDKYENV